MNLNKRQCKAKAKEQITKVLKQEKAAIPGVDESDNDQSNIAAAMDSSSDDDEQHSEEEDPERLAIT
jgi:hypothetical protein